MTAINPITTTPVVGKIELHYSNSKKLLLKYRDEYNSRQTGKGSLKRKLRSTHIQLVLRMHALYAGMLKGLQATQADQLKDGILPVFRTSNGALAKELGTCKETIINLRKRLVEANIIAYKKFRGCNGAYELEINAKLLYLQDPKSRLPINLNGLFLASQMKTFDYTVSGTPREEYPEKDTKKERNTEGEETAKDVENFSLTDGSAVPSSANIQETNSGNATNVTDSAAPRNSKNQDTSPPRLRPAPPLKVAFRAGADELPERMPSTMEEAIGFLSPDNQRKVRYAAGMCWSKALATLYKDEWLTDEQKQRGMIALAEYIGRTSHPKRYDAFRGEIQERIDMAFEWVNDKKGRFVLLPRYYFDLRNEKTGGFKHTEKWMKKKQVRKFRKARRTLVTKSVNTFIKALAPESGIDRKELYHQLTTTIRTKYGAEIVAIFEARVNQAILTMK